MLLPYI